MSFNQMCVDCTEFIEDQGLYGHPNFTTELAWLEHRHKAHGGPKPKEPEPQHDGPENVQ